MNPIRLAAERFPARSVATAVARYAPGTSPRFASPSDALGVSLTELSAEQAAYIGVPVEGPYKPDHYRY